MKDFFNLTTNLLSINKILFIIDQFNLFTQPKPANVVYFFTDNCKKFLHMSEQNMQLFPQVRPLLYINAESNFTKMCYSEAYLLASWNILASILSFSRPIKVLLSNTNFLPQNTNHMKLKLVSCKKWNMHTHVNNTFILHYNGPTKNVIMYM